MPIRRMTCINIQSRGTWYIRGRPLEIGGGGGRENISVHQFFFFSRSCLQEFFFHVEESGKLGWTACRNFFGRNFPCRNFFFQNCPPPPPLPISNGPPLMQLFLNSYVISKERTSQIIFVIVIGFHWHQKWEFFRLFSSIIFIYFHLIKPCQEGGRGGGGFSHLS